MDAELRLGGAITKEQYQQWVWDSYGGREMSMKDQLINNALGLGGEAGEVEDLIKKIYFLNRNPPRYEMVEELGDVLWHLTCICSIIGCTLEDVMQYNIKKLEERYPDGKPE